MGDEPDDDWKAAALARYRAAYPPGEPSHRQWEAAFHELCQNDNGAPLARLLRSVAPSPDGARSLIPADVLVELAQLLDPAIFWSRFGKPPGRRAVRLKAVALTDLERDRLKRDGSIWSQVLQLLQQGEAVTEAIRIVADRYGLSDRTVEVIWSDARKQQGEGMIPKSRRRKPK